MIITNISKTQISVLIKNKIGIAESKTLRPGESIASENDLMSNQLRIYQKKKIISITEPKNIETISLSIIPESIVEKKVNILETTEEAEVSLDDNLTEYETEVVIKTKDDVDLDDFLIEDKKENVEKNIKMNLQKEKNIIPKKKIEKQSVSKSKQSKKVSSTNKKEKTKNEEAASLYLKKIKK